jgi:hypothetical protein
MCYIESVYLICCIENTRLDIELKKKYWKHSIIRERKNNRKLILGKENKMLTRKIYLKKLYRKYTCIK